MNNAASLQRRFVSDEFRTIPSFCFFSSRALRIQKRSVLSFKRLHNARHFCSCSCVRCQRTLFRSARVYHCGEIAGGPSICRGPTRLSDSISAGCFLRLLLVGQSARSLEFKGSGFVFSSIALSDMCEKQPLLNLPASKVNIVRLKWSLAAF